MYHRIRWKILIVSKLLGQRRRKLKKRKENMASKISEQWREEKVYCQQNPGTTQHSDGRACQPVQRVNEKAERAMSHDPQVNVQAQQSLIYKKPKIWSGNPDDVGFVFFPYLLSPLFFSFFIIFPPYSNPAFSSLSSIYKAVFSVHLLFVYIFLFLTFSPS